MCDGAGDSFWQHSATVVQVKAVAILKVVLVLPRLVHQVLVARKGLLQTEIPTLWSPSWLWMKATGGYMVRGGDYCTQLALTQLILVCSDDGREGTTSPPARSPWVQDALHDAEVLLLVNEFL